MKPPYWWLLAITLSTSLAAQTVPRPPTIVPISDPALAPMATTAPTAPAAPAAKPAKKPKPAAPRKKHTAKSVAAKPASTNAPAAISPAVKLVPGPAVVTGEAVNVRGQPSLRAEVITRLNRGDGVTVLGEVTPEKPEKPKKRGTAQWARIAFPTNVPVWVFAEFVDPTNKTVTVAKLNLRAGPGENFSVVGTLSKGDTVNETLAKDHWLAIEPPTNTAAFIAAEFLKEDLKPEMPAPPVAPAATNVVVIPVVTVPTVAPAATNVVVTPVVTNLTVASLPAEITNAVAATTNAPAPPATTAGASNTVATAVTPPPPVPVVTATNEPPPPPPAPVAEEPPPKRIVQREGIVRTSWSIQAPSWVELANPDTGETMDYLYSPSPRLDLKRYRGLRVLVTGEEGLDRRWKNTPVLTIRKIQLAE